MQELPPLRNLGPSMVPVGGWREKLLLDG